MTGSEMLKIERELSAVYGRHHDVESNEEFVVVGLIGSLYYHDLTEFQRNHIRAFYNIGPVREEYLPDYPVRLNRSLYTGFIKYHLNERNETK